MKYYCKKVLLCATLYFGSIPLCLKANQLQKAAVAITIVAVGYASSFVYHMYVYRQAVSRYENPLVVAAAYADNDHESLYKELWPIINIDNFHWSPKTSPYHNYPIVEFVNQIEYYIKILSRGSRLTLPFQLSYDMSLLTKQLERLRFYCVSHKDYMEQRRKADMFIQRNLSHIVIH